MKKAKNAQSYVIFVRCFPEANSGYICLPAPKSNNPITLGEFSKAHRYSTAQASPEQWIEIFQEDDYFRFDDERRPPKYSWRYIDEKRKGKKADKIVTIKESKLSAFRNPGKVKRRTVKGYKPDSDKGSDHGDNTTPVRTPEA